MNITSGSPVWRTVGVTPTSAPTGAQTSVADPERFDADPNPTFQADADPDPNPFTRVRDKG